MKFRVIFDRSIFHGKNFEKIKASRLLDSIKKEKIRIYFTTVFWEETLQYIQTSPDNLASQLKYLFSIDTNKWFRKLEDIISLELNNKWGIHKYYVLSKAEIEDKKQDFLDILDGSLSFDKALNENKKVIAGKLRRAEWLKKIRQSFPRVNNDFNSFFRNEESIIFDRLLLPLYPGTKYNWISNKDRCRLTNQYMKAFTSLMFLACNDHSLQIDKNDRSDAEQLSFLIFADLFVSNDKRYMKKAFDLLFGKSEKRFLNLEEFIEFIR